MYTQKSNVRYVDSYDWAEPIVFGSAHTCIIQGFPQSCRWPVHFFVMSIVARYSIFRRLSSVGNTLLDLVTFRSCRLKPSMSFVVLTRCRVSTQLIPTKKLYRHFQESHCIQILLKKCRHSFSYSLYSIFAVSAFFQLFSVFFLSGLAFPIASASVFNVTKA